jgi:hypothetical protein
MWRWNFKIACSLIFLNPGIELSRLYLMLFPSKITSVSQPLDQGIIKGINLNYRERMRSLVADMKSASFTTELSKPYQFLMQQFVLYRRQNNCLHEQCRGVYRKEYFLLMIWMMNCLLPIAPDILHTSNIDLWMFKKHWPSSGT